MSKRLTVGVVVYPGVTALDFVGPTQILSEAMGFTTLLLWKDTAPVMTDAGYAVLPTASFAQSPPLDILLVPGGSGQQPALNDEDVLTFVQERGASARFVCSVCTGSLFLAKAGLLDGYRATSHWAFVEDLSRFGAQPVHDRVVIDRNRITGAGVSAGIDFALTLLAHLKGDDFAQVMQLSIEYDPDPPFDCGSPDKSRSDIVEQLRSAFRAMIAV